MPSGNVQILPIYIIWARKANGTELIFREVKNYQPTQQFILAVPHILKLTMWREAQEQTANIQLM